MKFYCVAPWVHSGIQRYLADKEYNLTQDQVDLFTSMKNNRRDDDDIGAMKRFRPADAEAKACMEKLIAKAQKGESEKKSQTASASADAPGISNTPKKSGEALLAAIAAKKAGQ